MRRILLATAAIALGGANVALAAGPDANIDISADNPAECHIITYDSSISLTGVAVDDYVTANFQYTCNFVGSPKLTFDSGFGGLKNGASTVDYGIFLNDDPISGVPSGWQQASLTPKSYGPGGDYGIITSVSVPGDPVTPNFAVGLSQAMTLAGLYQDTLTISISP